MRLLNIKNIILCHLVLVVSCTSQTHQDAETANDSPATFAVTDSTRNLAKEGSISDERPDTLPVLLKQVELKRIKKRYVANYTSGVLGPDAASNLKKGNPSDLFYGVYYFTSTDYKMPYIAKAIVSREQEEWIYENAFENLLEITLFTDELNPFKEAVSIGAKKSSVLLNLGKPYRILENNYIYVDQFGNGVTVVFEENEVRAIRVGRYYDENEITPVVLRDRR